MEMEAGCVVVDAAKVLMARNEYVDDGIPLGRSAVVVVGKWGRSGSGNYVRQLSGADRRDGVVITSGDWRFSSDE